MNLTEANSFIPLIAAICYTILSITSFIRRSKHEKISRWLLAFLVVSIVWEFLVLIADDTRGLPNLSIVALLIGITLLNVTTAVYSEWERPYRWSIPGLVGIAVTLFIYSLIPSQTVTIPFIDLPKIKYSNIFSNFLWAILSGYILIRAWRHYRKTLLPWHANRLLFWFISLFITFLGEGFLIFKWTGLTAAGQIIRFIGVIGLTSAISSHRIFDIRTRSQRTLAIFIINLITSSPLAFVILLVQWLARAEPFSTRVILTLITIALSLFLYQPFHRIVERNVYRYFPGERLDTSKVVRAFSQAVYRTLDVNQLSLVIIGTLSELLGTKRGTLMLMTQSGDSLEIEPIPVMGQIPRKNLQSKIDSPFLTSLVKQHQPLLQYEIDFNPDFTQLSDEERSWLKELGMEVYVPISTGTEIAGLIALGPRSSGSPFQPGELELMQILADQTVVALQNSRLYSELANQNDKIRQLNVNLVTQNERLEIMDRVKSDFITIASHELRTPLTQVKGYADILAAMNEENALTREQTRGIVGHINRATIRLEGLITAMLDASQIDVEGIQLSLVETSIESIIRISMEPLIQAMRERRIALTTEGLKNLPLIQGDFKRLVQAFTNLIGNAVKYTPDHGSIAIQGMALPSRNGEGECVEVVISDTGIGIDPKFHDLIFEKFFRIGDPQLHSTGSTKFKGAGPGLGLPIAKGVIEAHGGRIWVESDLEDEHRLPGSCFHIVLPVHPPKMDHQSMIESSNRSALPG